MVSRSMPLECLHTAPYVGIFLFRPIPIVGPYHLNGCPLRRINQIYVIATKTKLDVSAVKLPERVNDEYFKRQKLNKSKHMEGEIFDTEKAVSSSSWSERGGLKS